MQKRIIKTADGAIAVIRSDKHNESETGQTVRDLLKAHKDFMDGEDI